MNQFEVWIMYGKRMLVQTHPDNDYCPFYGSYRVVAWLDGPPEEFIKWKSE